MAHPEYIRMKAIQLRVDRKMTIDEIAECLDLNRTTVYYWVKNIEVPRKPNVEFPTWGRIKGNEAMQAKYREKRKAAYQEGVEEFPKLDTESGFRDFVCMYIGEGYKRDRNQVALCNSDPSVVRLGHIWISRMTSNKIQHTIQFHADQDLEVLKTFWSNRLELPKEKIHFQRKSNSNQLTGRNWRSRYGVLTVRVGDTYLRSKLEAWMDLVKADWR